MMSTGASAADSSQDEQQQMQALEDLFARHMRARAMLRSVAKAEQEAIAELIWMLKAVPSERRQEVVARCVERAAAGIISDSG